MSDTKSKSAYVLTILIAILSLIAAAGGLLSNELYQDNFLVTSGWRGNDLVTLFIAVPLLLAALVLTWRGSQRARLVWLGMLDYTLYNFAFYLFGTAFNSFFLLYVIIFTLSIFALIFGLVQTDVPRIGRQFRDRTPVKWISGYMLFVAAGLTTVYTIQSVGFITGGELPPIVTLTGHPTNVVFALDLSLVVPVLVLAAIWLWQRRPWGYVLAVIANVKGAVYMMALAATTITAVQSGASNDMTQLGLWVFIGVGSLLVSLLLLSNLRPVTQPVSIQYEAS